MEVDAINKLVDWWQKSYFTIPLLFLCMLLAISVGIIYFRFETSYIFFLLYITVGIGLCPGIDLIFEPLKPIPTTRRTRLVEMGNIIFALIEFVAFWIFFIQIVTLRKIKVFLIIAAPFYLLLSILVLLRVLNTAIPGKEITAMSFRLNSIEFILLLVPCLAYFYEEMKRDNRSHSALLKSPGFWITIGLFFYLIISLPFIFIGDRLIITDKTLYRVMFSIHFVAFSFLFICLTKAFSCKTPITT